MLLLGETRTRILLLYVVLMFLVAAASVPMFLVLLFTKVDTRVQQSLTEQMQSFSAAYRHWQSESTQQSDADLRRFLDRYLARQIPEDDNFLIAIVDNQFYKSTPIALPVLLTQNTTLTQRWLYIDRSIAGKQDTDDPKIGSILYLAQPLVLRGKIRGTFVVAHPTAGEHQEALDGVTVFIQVALGVVFVTFVIAWFATAQVLAPVKQLANAARSVSEADLSQRLPNVEGYGEMAELAKTFNTMMGRLQEAFVSQRNFINDAGHELRTPITIIQGHLELMGEDPQEQQETLELVMDELDRMSRMVNDLILLARAERPDFLQVEAIDVSSFTEELFFKSQALAPRQWQLKLLGQGQMRGDRQRLTGAMLNLTQNAVHHTQPDDVIEIGSAIGKREVQFWVRDTGEGIAPADQVRIFERFSRLTHTYRRSEGSGLGLSIVRAITEAHGGRVELVSQVGVGSIFTLILPLEPPTTRLF